jgi:hypothetical protein
MTPKKCVAFETPLMECKKPLVLDLILAAKKTPRSAGVLDNNDRHQLLCNYLQCLFVDKYTLLRDAMYFIFGGKSHAGVIANQWRVLFLKAMNERHASPGGKTRAIRMYTCIIDNVPWY